MHTAHLMNLLSYNYYIENLLLKNDNNNNYLLCFDYEREYNNLFKKYEDENIIFFNLYNFKTDFNFLPNTLTKFKTIEIFQELNQDCFITLVERQKGIDFLIKELIELENLLYVILNKRIDR